MLDADVGADGRSGDEVDELDAEESEGASGSLRLTMTTTFITQGGEGRGGTNKKRKATKSMKRGLVARSCARLNFFDCRWALLIYRAAKNESRRLRCDLDTRALKRASDGMLDGRLIYDRARARMPSALL